MAALDRFLTGVPSDAAEWIPTFIHPTTQPFFRLASKLGSGENCAVYSLGPRDQPVMYSEEESVGSEEEEECESDVSSMSVSSQSSASEKGSGSKDKPGKRRRGCSEEDVREVEICSVSEDSDEPQGVDPDAVRIHINGPLGKTQVVAKQFRHLEEEDTPCLWSLPHNTLHKVFNDREDAEDYLRRRQLPASAYEHRKLGSHIDAGNAMFTEFRLEALCSLFLTQLAKTQTPHIMIAFEALQHDNTGYLLLERVDCTLDDLLNEPRVEARWLHLENELSNEAIASLILQALVGLATMQDACALKHHDLHSGNVFVKLIDEDTKFKGQALSTATHFHYHVNGVDLYMPNYGLIAKLGDFGMSSLNMYGRRLQRLDMDCFNDDVQKWGAWNALYEGERGYDTQTLFADMPLDGRHHNNRPLRKLLKFIKTAAMGKRGRVTPKKSRPLPGHVSNLPASSLLNYVFVKKPEPWFDFRVRPSGDKVCIITLGDTRWTQ